MATPLPPNRASFTIEEAEAATRGTIVRRGPELQRGSSGVVSDSRAVALANVFVALRGESHDGHAFLDAACRRGPSFIVVERGRAPSGIATNVLEVDDTLVALGDLARVHLAKWRAHAPGNKVVAITGSAGKTTTKELAAALLGAVGPTHFTAGNLNNRVGVPMVVFGLEDSHRFAVLEMGMSVPGELDAITSFARPDVSLVTNVGMAHAEGVGGPDGIMHEKAAVYRALDTGGVAIVNADDERVKRASEGTRAQTIVTFGAAKAATYRLLRREPRGESGSRVVLAAPGRELTLQLPLPGEAAAIDLAAALAAQETASGILLSAEAIDAALATVRLAGRANVVRLAEDIVVLDDTYNANPASMRAALATLATVRLAGRATVVRLAEDIVLLDDTYNANPASMRAALATLAEIAGERRRVAILGEMKELGVHAEAEHVALGDAIAAAGVSLAIGCGGLISRSLERAAELGVTCVSAASTEEAVREAKSRVRASDAVLVKGSRSVGAERVVAALIETWPAATNSATALNV